jgi:hypothetical protein
MQNNLTVDEMPFRWILNFWIDLSTKTTKKCPMNNNDFPVYGNFNTLPVYHRWGNLQTDAIYDILQMKTSLHVLMSAI